MRYINADAWQEHHTRLETEAIMISKVTLVLLGMIALAAADSFERYAYAPPRYSSRSSEESYESSEGIYDFNWNVDYDPSRNAFGHQATGDGDNAQGSYYVQLPDGRLQKVSFRVDGDSGYIADVTYSGEAQFPSSESSESYESREAPRRFYYAPDSNESK